MRAFPLGGLLLGFFLASAPAASQTTGSINGAVSDNTGAILPGATVTATSPAMMGVQTTVTNEQGQYRFPALTPGTYRLVYELTGFATMVREGITVSIGFTSTVNVQLVLAQLQETVMVSGYSPVVDVQNTNIQSNFKTDILKSIPNARDVWGLIAVTPGTMMTAFDVGGSRAGNQTGYNAYGFTGQVRAQIDGVNTTEGTGGTAGYFDYSSFEEVQVGTDSNDASMPTPGVLLNAVLKSGGNRLKGDVYFDYENPSLQGRNVTDALRRQGVGEGTRITTYRDPNFNIGGPIVKDRFWYFAGIRSQRVGTTVTGFPADDPSDFESITKLDALTYKLTYQISPRNKLSHYVQGRRKLQPYRDAASTRYQDAVYRQDSDASYGNLDWSRIVSDSFFFDTRLSTWGYNWPNSAYGVNGEISKDIRNRMQELQTGNVAGGANASRTDRRRYQFDWQGTLFREQWAGGNHSIKIGYLTEWENTDNRREGYKDAALLIFNSPAGSPDFTTPYRVTISNTPTTAIDALWHHGAFVQDQIKRGRVTMNVGLRWDYYSVYYPDQEISPHLYRDFFYAGAPLPNGYSIPASYPDFKVPARTNILQFTKAFGPRLGIAWDVRGTGKTVLKANWGRFYNNPGPRGSDVNPIQAISYTFGWNDVNRDRLFTQGELGSFVSSSGGVSNTIDPNIGQPYQDDLSVWAEREIKANVSARLGLISRRQENDFQNIELARLGSLYTATLQASDPGPDGIAGTTDDGAPFTVYDIPPAVPLPASRTRLDTPGDNDSRSRTIEVTVNKRMTGRWSTMATFHHTWLESLRNGHPQNPNQAVNNDTHTTAWAFKAFMTYRAPWGLVVSPLLRHQSGDALGRIVQITGLRAGTFNYPVEPVGTYREKNVTLFDTRVEKVFKQQLSLFFDAFNIANSNAAEAQDDTVGRRTAVVDGQSVAYQRFLRPTVILGPRVYRLGLKFSF